MSATERERLEKLILLMQSGDRLSISERLEVANFLRGYQYLAARVAGEWQTARELEAQYGIR